MKESTPIYTLDHDVVALVNGKHKTFRAGTLVADMTDHATTPEPAPTEGHGPSIHDLVVQDVLARKAFGLAKYGVLLRVGDGRRHLVDAYQEALDLAVYLRQELARQGIDPQQQGLVRASLAWFSVVFAGVAIGLATALILR